MPALLRSTVVVLLVLGAAACKRQEPEVSSNDPFAAADSAATGSANLRKEAEKLVAFLRGQRRLPTELLADSVALYIAPEGGGQQRRVSREELSDRAAWRVGPRSLVPAESLTELTTVPGRHINCQEAPLETKFPSLARSPHIGARLNRAGAEGCLQVWNVTFVFDDEASPRLQAVVYDQWEW